MLTQLEIAGKNLQSQNTLADIQAEEEIVDPLHTTISATAFQSKLLMHL
jgi:hypothetical protein